MKGLVVVYVVSIVAISHAFKIQPKILNGIRTVPRDFPFFVLLNFPTSNTCGGSIISDRWILTAAHCFMSNKTAQVFFGWADVGYFLEASSVGPDNFYPHPDYEYGALENDIGLLKLPHRISLGGDVQVAKLPTDCRPVHNGNIPVIALGTGQYTVEDSGINKRFTLRQIKFVTAPTRECEPDMTTEDMNQVICAEVTNGQSIYLGDSGGPIMNADDGTVIGVTDMVVEVPNDTITDPQKRCLAQIFANVRYHFKWISQITGMTLPEC